MPVVNESVVWLNSGDRSEVSYEDCALGAGRQARVVRLVEIDGKKVYDWLLKIYFDRTPQARTHAVAFAAYLARQNLQSEGLLGLPREAFECAGGSGSVGYLMRQVPGRDMDSTSLYGWLRGKSLARRLGLAWQLAASVARLHDNRVVHADVNDSNIIVDDANEILYLVDADGGGVLTCGATDRFEPDLFPTILGKELTMDPELLAARKSFPTVVSDNYSLAVMIHRMLLPYGTGGIHPFFFLPAVRTSADPTVSWPPDAASYPHMKGPITQHNRLLDSLGDKIKTMLIAAFGLGRVSNPDLRPTAQEWADVLEAMSRWTYRCSCDNEFVAQGRNDCPFCNARVQHAVLDTGTARLEVREDFELLSPQVGFQDGVYVAAEVKRVGNCIAVAPKKGAETKVAPGRPKSVSLESRSGAKATIRIQVF